MDPERGGNHHIRLVYGWSGVNALYLVNVTPYQN